MKNSRGGYFNRSARKSGGYKNTVFTISPFQYTLEELQEDIEKYGYNEEESQEMINFMIKKGEIKKLPNNTFVKT